MTKTVTKAQKTIKRCLTSTQVHLHFIKVSLFISTWETPRQLAAAVHEDRV